MSDLSRKEIGARGEQEACGFLLGEGHKILRRNWRSGHLELDIITVKDGILHIVEVKTRSAGAPVSPEINVDRSKRARMVKAAGDLLRSGETSALCYAGEVQFDVLTVVFDGESAVLEYFPAAFIPIYT